MNFALRWVTVAGMSDEARRNLESIKRAAYHALPQDLHRHWPELEPAIERAVSQAYEVGREERRQTVRISTESKEG